jgi:riboflavin kinase / FMN adenylyltransferase
MRIVRLDGVAARDWADAALSVGNFDGVHRGHQALAAAVVAEARRLQSPGLVLSFDPHPSRVLAPERAPATLMTLEQRAEVLGGLGVDRLVVLPFTRALSQVSPEAFARSVLVDLLGARAVVVGANFRFGHGRVGDVLRLSELGEELGFRVVGVPPVVAEGSPISSTRVREALGRGDVSAAGALLGRPYFVDGAVVPGLGRGRTLGVATANLDPVNETLPSSGVYACHARVAGEQGTGHAAVVNLGRRPTFGGGSLQLEAHLLDFDGDLYGRRLRLFFVERLREERAFEGPQALVRQIELDIASARAVLEKVPENGV